jgi:hypothetical protein
MTGPAAIANGRAAYNDMICRTGGEQTLQMIVRMRYNELTSMLAVASVTATVKVSAAAEVQFGFGESENYTENLVPFAAGMAYEESPTIIYQPVQGSARMSEMLSPLAVETVAQIVRAEDPSVPILHQLVVRMNDLRSPSAWDHGSGAGFLRAVHLISELHAAGVAGWLVPRDPKEEIQFVILDYAPDHTAQVEELIGLLAITGAEADGGEIVLPVRLAVGVGPRGSIDLQTRSVHGLLRLAGAGVQVPREHIEGGIAEPADAAEQDLVRLRVLSSAEPPVDAMVAVRHHDWWFYIDGTDAQSKASFVVLQMLLEMAMAGEAHVQAAPLLTVPVGS